ncbi:AMP-binding protein [Dietzia sp. SLG310A2-38A2]|uniref:AMP-binding protein n=1 Tax=Dietzia sp. SLG310A2-38A2 TaxID=1630643 RepID=UPI0015F8EA72|nr:AMP-binding protein [Dietzia sp. SLG310A2-38A2]MBB1030518.1 AMP-binding protein [Dietzia sp. SLG310A2-38A2]
MLDHIRDRATAEPDLVALVDDTTVLSWGDVASVVDRLARALRQTASGIDERVAVVGENRVETLLAHVAAIGAGVGTVAISRQLTAREMTDQFLDSGCVAVVTGPGGVGAASEAATRAGLNTMITHNVSEAASSSASLLTWDAALSRGGAEPGDLAERPARPPLVYTSGTTGRARGTEVRWLPTPASSAAEFEAGIARRSGYPPGAHLVAGPLQHNGPLTSIRHLLSGQPVVILGRFDAERALELIETHSVTSTLMVPTHFTRLLAVDPQTRNRYDVSSLTLVAHTGSACPADVKRAMIEWFGPVLVESYGGSEIGTVCKIDSTQWLDHPRSVGRVVEPFEVVVVGADGETLGAGETGILGFRTPPGREVVYHDDPEKTAKAYILPGVATLGDVGHVDAEGYVFITDRVSDMVVSGGVNLYPAESEQVLSGHPDVSEVGVIGVPDTDLGEALLALVVPVAGRVVDVDDLRTYARQTLASYKCPKHYVVVDQLARNAMGKLDKKALRAPYWDSERTIAG